MHYYLLNVEWISDENVVIVGPPIRNSLVLID